MTQQQDVRRTIDQGRSEAMPIAIDITTPLYDWLSAKASTYTLRWLLLHAESGVVWGEWQGKTLALSAPVATLDWKTLHQLRLFGENGELFVWQGPRAPQARLIEDGKGDAAEWIEEQQVLWGNRVDSASTASPGFTSITEGSQGIVHAPPIGDSLPIYPKANEKQAATDRARLLVRHYLGENDAGVVRVSHSRLVKFLKPGEK